MKLLTKTLQKQLPPLRSQEAVEDPIVKAHFFNPAGSGDWWITEGSVEEDDFVMFGLCAIFEPEMGYVSLNEMQAIKGPLGLGIERDLHWRPKPLSEVRAGAEPWAS
jgi:hypothetical protein